VIGADRPARGANNHTGRSIQVAAALVALATLVVMACSGSPGSSPATTAPPSITTEPMTGRTCRPAQPVPPSNQLQTITTGNVERSYVLSVPSSYDGTRPAPLIFDFYGRGGDAEEQVADFELDDEATAAGVLVVTPQAAPDRDPSQNAWAGDVELVSAILQSLEQQWCIDRNAVFVAGFSDGGVFAASVACALPGTFAAIGSVAELHFPAGCPADATPSLIGFHGRSDPFVPFDGGATDEGDGRNGLPGEAVPLPPSASIQSTFAAFARHNGCRTDPTTTPVMADVEHLTYPGCPDGRAVELYVIDDGGHEWPGDPGPQPAPEGSLDANRLMVQFFLDHRRR
jgi:polyhydroxybutyrate depolymerase